MNGYLNNLTMRTLNTGNGVEPRLPALFEPRAFESGPPAAERGALFEEEVTTVSESRPAPLGRVERISSDTPDGPGLAKPEIEDSAVNTDEDSEPPVFHEDEREDPVETLTVQASLQPRAETVEIVKPIKEADVETAPFFEQIEERLTSSLEPHHSVAPVPRIQIQNQPVTSRRVPQRNSEAQQSVLIPTPSPQTADFQANLTIRRTTLPNTTESVVAPIAVIPIEEISQTEHRVTDKPEPEPEFESTTQSTYRRVNPKLATSRDTRQQQWRRRQSPVPIESEPSINVTIGRIEVRAVPADNRKTTSPRRSESPVMPLEDYLRKQRRGGER